MLVLKFKDILEWLLIGACVTVGLSLLIFSMCGWCKNPQLTAYLLIAPLFIGSFFESKFDAVAAYGYPNGHVDWRIGFVIFSIIAYAINPASEMSYLYYSVIAGAVVGKLYQFLCDRREVAVK
jgi:hypothetical protein